MQLKKKLTSASIPMLVLVVLIASLWGVLLINNKQHLAQASHEQEKGFFPMTLPTVLAPVIREEVHKKTEQDDERFVLSCKIPKLLEIMNVRQ